MAQDRNDYQEYIDFLKQRQEGKWPEALPYDESFDAIGFYGGGEEKLREEINPLVPPVKAPAPLDMATKAMSDPENVPDKYKDRAKPQRDGSLSVIKYGIDPKTKKFKPYTAPSRQRPVMIGNLLNASRFRPSIGALAAINLASKDALAMNTFIQQIEKWKQDQASSERLAAEEERLQRQAARDQIRGELENQALEKALALDPMEKLKFEHASRLEEELAKTDPNQEYNKYASILALLYQATGDKRYLADTVVEPAEYDDPWFGKKTLKTPERRLPSALAPFYTGGL